MKIEKNKLVKVFWKSEEFEGRLCIDSIDGLILDTIKVLGKTSGVCQEIPFYIHKTNGKTFICPCSYAEDIYAMADRVTNANVLKINSEDYVQNYSTMGGAYEFVLNDKIDNNFDDFLKEYTHE